MAVKNKKNMDVKLLLFGMMWFIIGHCCVFIQLNGQFKWEWFQQNEFILALCGIIISFFYIWGTKYTEAGFGGLLWPTRFVGFSIGITVYALGVSLLFKQGITPKTLVSLSLAFLLVCIQVLWKDGAQTVQ